MDYCSGPEVKRCPDPDIREVKPRGSAWWHQLSSEQLLISRDRLAAMSRDQYRHPDDWASEDDVFREALGPAIRQADIVTWEPDVFEMATAGCDSLIGKNTDVMRQFLPAPQLWILPGPFTLIRNDGQEESGAFASLFVLPATCEDGGIDTLVTAVCVDLSERTVRFYHVVVCPHEPCNKVSAAVVTASSFLRSEFVGTQVVFPSRQVKRAAKRHGGEIHGVVRRIVLRKTASAGSGGDHGGGPVDWSCRWMVSAHWRAQFFPRSGCHRPVWIAPYAKGPADKPFKAAGATIFHASR